MILTGKEDPRIRKSIERINKAFEEMLLEMNYEDITMTKLIERANVNKKTFYHYYHNMNELLGEFIERLAQKFIFVLQTNKAYQDLDYFIKAIFYFAVDEGPLFEKIAFNKDFDYIKLKLAKSIQNNFTLVLKSNDFLTYYVISCVLSIYKYWVKTERKPSLNEVILITQQLINNGLKDYQTASKA